MALVVDDCSSKTPGRIDTSASDGDGSQVNQEHCKANRQRSKDLHGFTGVFSAKPQELSYRQEIGSRGGIVEVDQHIKHNIKLEHTNLAQERERLLFEG